MNETKSFEFDKEEYDPSYVLKYVYGALEEKGYNPINQLTGYLISGDPTYITTNKNARKMIRKVFRDSLIEELIANYMENLDE
jgi:uncharacterized protein (UPF0297 family)